MRTATAVMSSLGAGLAAPVVHGGENTFDDLRWRQIAQPADDLEQTASAVNSWPLAFIASDTPSVQNTNRSPVCRANVTSS